MPRQKFPSIDSLKNELLTGFVDKILHETPQVAVLFAASYVDHALYSLLKNTLCGTSTSDGLLSSEGAIGSLQRRADLAYCLGLISKGQKQNIDAIGQIRNIFAHTWETGIGFDYSRIRELCLTLKERRLTETEAAAFAAAVNVAEFPVTPPQQDPRRRFVYVSLALVAVLLEQAQLTKKIEPLELPEWDY